MWGVRGVRNIRLRTTTAFVLAVPRPKAMVGMDVKKKRLATDQSNQWKSICVLGKHGKRKQDIRA